MTDSTFPVLIIATHEGDHVYVMGEYRSPDQAVFPAPPARGVTVRSVRLVVHHEDRDHILPVSMTAVHVDPGDTISVTYRAPFKMTD